MARNRRSAENDAPKGGCLQKLLIGFVVLILLSIVSPLSHDESTTNGNDTQTVKITNTPKPTKTPKPTATAEPNFATMTLEQTVSELVDYYCTGDYICTKKSIINGGVSIDIKVESFLTEKTMVRDCCRLYMNIAKNFFTNNDASTLAINFDTPGRDMYGNEVIVRAMEIFLKRDTAKRINYEYMIDNLYSSTNNFLKITDRHYVHSDLQKGVY